MYDYEPEEQPRLESNQPSSADHYLRGFSDGYNRRPRARLPTAKAQEAYNRGYDHALSTRPKTERRRKRTA